MLTTIILRRHDRGGPTLRRVAAAALAVAAVIVLTAAPAGAHTVSGTQPTNYDSELLSLSPRIEGLSLRLLDLGNKVELTNHSPIDVVVLGSDREPETLVGPGGKVSPGHTVRWRDKRTQWHGTSRPPAVRAAPDEEHVVGQWTIPIRAGEVAPVPGLAGQATTDGRAGQVVVATGRITWVPGPSAVPWLLASLGLCALTISLAWARRWGPALAAALALLIAVDAVHGFASAAAAGDSILVTVARVVGVGFISTLAWAGGIWAIGRLQRQNELGLLLAGLSAFVIGLYSLGDTVILGRSQVAYVFPAVAARAAVSVSMGVGIGLGVAVVAVFKRTPGLITRASEARQKEVM